jgi:hypothetical protein
MKKGDIAIPPRITAGVEMELCVPKLDHDAAACMRRVAAAFSNMQWR